MAWFPCFEEKKRLNYPVFRRGRKHIHKCTVWVISYDFDCSDDHTYTMQWILDLLCHVFDCGRGLKAGSLGRCESLMQAFLPFHSRSPHQGVWQERWCQSCQRNDHVCLRHKSKWTESRLQGPSMLVPKSHVAKGKPSKRNMDGLNRHTWSYWGEGRQRRCLV